MLSIKLNYLVNSSDYEVHVLNTNGSVEHTFYEFDKRIIFHSLGNKRFKIIQLSNYKKKLNLQIKNIDPDIIINTDNGLKGSLLTYLIKQDFPLIYERHIARKLPFTNAFDSFKFKFSNLILDRNIRAYKAFVVLNELQKNEWKGGNIKVVPNPIAILEVKGDERAKTVLSVGRFAPEKRYDRMLKLWNEVATKNHDWKLQIYGEGDKNFYNDLLRELDLVDSVDLLEPIKNIENIYTKGSIFLSTSSSESFGLSIAEALGYGLPVVAFKTDGSSNLISDNENGFLISQNDKTNFVKQLDLLIKNEQLRERLSENAKNSLYEYEIHNVMKKWTALFKSI